MADILLFATADWDHPVWTNKQHVACALNDLGYRILYVESVGLRGLRQNKSDLLRLLKRLIKAFRPPRQVRPGLWCWSPLVIPGASQNWLLKVNRILFSCGLRSAMRSLNLNPICLWTYNPMTLAYSQASLDVPILYHCVDDIQSQPGMNAVLITGWEEKLCRRSVVVYVTSPALLETRRLFNPQTYFLPNVADTQHFGSALRSDLPIPAEFDSIPEPRLCFVGSISQYKLDLDMIVAIARRRPEWSWVFIGPIGEGEAQTDLDALMECNNVHILGTRQYRLLPAYMKACSVGLLPLRMNSYTHSMFPMKFFEYLAAGLPVVATEINALKEYGNLVSIVAVDSKAFEAGIETALSHGQSLKERQKRLEFAGQYNYQTRTVLMLEKFYEHRAPSPNASVAE